MEFRGFSTNNLSGPPAPFKQASATTAHDQFERNEFFAAIESTQSELAAIDYDVPSGHVLELWYIRIQSLLILQQGQQAAEEIMRNLSNIEKILPQLSSADRLSAWRLRILTIPVKTKGVNQSAVQQYYNLAYEAREEAAMLPKGSEQQNKWLHAVEVAGQYALSTLIALKDYATAIQLLKAHYNAEAQVLYATLLALLYICIGDTLSAQPWMEKVEDKGEQDKLHQLSVFADDDSRKATIMGLKELYDGQIKQAIAELEDKTVAERTSRGLLVTTNIANLAVLYDLCYADPTPYQKNMRDRLIEAGNTHLETADADVYKIIQ